MVLGCLPSEEPRSSWEGSWGLCGAEQGDWSVCLPQPGSEALNHSLPSTAHRPTVHWMGATASQTHGKFSQETQTGHLTGKQRPVCGYRKVPSHHPHLGALLPDVWQQEEGASEAGFPERLPSQEMGAQPTPGCRRGGKQVGKAPWPGRGGAS